jgi:hypothetical protein
MGSFLGGGGVKRPGREANHAPPTSAEVKECVELYLHSPNTPSWHGAQLKKHRDPVGLGIFLFTTASRTALGPSQSPIQRLLRSLSLGVKRPGREADHSPPSNAEVKVCVMLYLHSPVRLHGVVLN